MDDLAQLDEKYSEDSFYYGWFVDEIFGYESMLKHDRLVETLKDDKFKWLFDTYLMR